MKHVFLGVQLKIFRLNLKKEDILVQPAFLIRLKLILLSLAGPIKKTKQALILNLTEFLLEMFQCYFLESNLAEKQKE